MRIKIGDTVYDAENLPVCIEMTEQDRRNIADMHPMATKYACFPDSWGTKKEMFKWMEEM